MARSFPIQWTTTWTGELAKTLAEILHQRIWYSSVNLPWYPIKCTAWICFTLFYHVLTISGGAGFCSTKSLKGLRVGDAAQLQNPVQCRPRQCQTSVQLYATSWWSNLYPLSNQRNSPLLGLCHHRANMALRNKSPGKADFGWTFTSI